MCNGYARRAAKSANKCDLGLDGNCTEVRRDAGIDPRLLSAPARARTAAHR